MRVLSTQVSVWVPVVVGLLGLAGVLGAQLIAGWREDRRWKREQQREDARWRRERDAEHEQRGYAGRRDAYAKLIGLLETWSWVLYPAQHRVLVEDGELTEDMRAELREMRTLAREALGPVNLYAPTEIRDRMEPAILSKADLTAALLAGERDGERLAPMWERTKATYLTLRAALRHDLGIDRAGTAGRADRDRRDDGTAG